MNANKRLQVLAIMLLIGSIISLGASAQTTIDEEFLLKKAAVQAGLIDKHHISLVEKFTIIHDHEVKPNGFVAIRWKNFLGQSFRQELQPKYKSPKSLYGYDAAVHGNIAAISAPKEGLMKTGSTYIFTYVNGKWVEDGKIVVNHAEANDGFGYQVAVYEGKVIIAAPGRDADGADEGIVYIYEKEGEDWQATTEISAKGFYVDLHFGRNMTLFDGQLMIGVTEKKDNIGSGNRYLFDLNSGKSGLIELLPYGAPAENQHSSVHDVAVDR